MNTPLFTAETSLYKTSRSYRGPGSRPAGDAGSTVVPQQGLCFEVVQRRMAALQRRLRPLPFLLCQTPVTSATSR